jgi:hypothetical protein
VQRQQASARLSAPVRRQSYAAAAGHEGCGGRVRRKALPRMAAFWLVAVLLGFVLLTSAAASPLYAVYQAQWKFSAATLTAVFAIYAIFLLVTLLLFGSVADYLGRRPVILAALAITAIACALFLAARGVGLLFAARALQGVAVGTATGGLGAALIDLQPEDTSVASRNAARSRVTSEMLFQVLTEREEANSVAIASNQAFSKAHMFEQTRVRLLPKLHGFRLFGCDRGSHERRRQGFSSVRRPPARWSLIPASRRSDEATASRSS